MRHEGTPPRAGQPGGDDLSFYMILSGRSLATRGSQELVLGDGDGVLVSSDDAACAFASPSSVKVVGLRLPRSALASLVPDLDEALMRRVPGNAGALALLRKYLEVVADDPALGARNSQRLIAVHLYDLTALALGTTRDGEALARRRTLGAARLAGIKANIVADLQDGDLDPTTVAARNRLSVRYLHKLFQNDGLTYSEFVLGQRLERAHSILRNPLHLGRTISAIAFDVGFNDLSYFNRAFRRRYGATPSDIRCSGDVLAT
jgi:AraC-like DNA-binding protein